ncbi:peptidoglycan D,D-transpeptidase FtsI family protein [Evansella tamaricis]|uniref:Penicillin-binding protein 2 n=1 Tax=Evansella tamaricis TaxID=2069301 RepID=A0ABS6JCP3_9BACI|nr:penicillin-binding protein 2 [Evansella tamaricis]MBU9711439.1 penicillin-binding protein 2 [Evansella tamaricis]
MQEKKVKKTHIPVRLNILFFVVFMLFSSLILRLGVVQIVQGTEFEEQLDQEVSISAPIEAPRGLLYDRYGNILVDNELLFTVTYTNRNMLPAEMLRVAQELNRFITVESPRTLNERELKDFWSVLYPEEFEAKLTVDEAKDLEIEDSEVHQVRIDRVTDEDLEQITHSGKNMEVFSIWREFTLGYYHLPHKVKRGISYEESAHILENLDNLPGIDIIRDSVRVYTYEDSLRGIIGQTGSIPREEIDFYLANGYERNEEVGTSYLEQQYESVLKGRKGRIDNFMDGSGNFTRAAEYHIGSRGNDLVLTYDMDLQHQVQEILQTRVDTARPAFIGNPDAHVVMMEPNTGEILAMYSYHSDTSSGRDREIRPFTQAYEMGSSIKGATVLAGYDTGVMPPGTTILDRSINLPGAQPISSHSTLGYINDVSALEQSSNIYMVYVAMRLVGYVPGVSGTNWGNFYRGYDVLRDYYAQFGLGIETGIDLPNEFKGISGGNSPQPGNLLFLTFGQFDTYTPLQLAQYISTIANDGYRIAPRVVKEIREPGETSDVLGPISQQMVPKVLNKLDVDESLIQRVKDGFRRVVYGNRGTARGYFQGSEYTVAGKTGTAQVRWQGREANNQTFVGFAPYENPEIAIAVVVPNISKSDTRGRGLANTISEDILEAYFTLKHNRQNPGNVLDDQDEEDEEDEGDADDE